MNYSHTGRALTVEEVAELLRISTSHTLRQVRSNGLPHVRLGRRIIIYEEALQQWINDKAAETTK